MVLPIKAAGTASLRMEDAAGTEVPAPFVYDPVSQKSAVNRRSLALAAGNAGITVPAGMAMSGSFTIEAFVKPAAAADATFVRKPRQDDKASEAGLRLTHFQQHNRYYFRTFVTPASGRRMEQSPGYYGSSAQYLGGKDLAWRHVALVYDAERLTVTGYVDGCLSSEEKLEKPLTFDEAPLVAGGLPASP